MPIFVFECPTCGKRVEHIYSRVEQADAERVLCPWGPHPIMSDGPLPDLVMRRVPAVSNFAFKGSGFHANDYPRKS
jgi:predicted nucleic acid-binding Zn ribbon protein